MGYLPPTTIASTLARIQLGDLILPAIQREYVWEPNQVVALFDSLMRDYPIGGFLSWRVDAETIEQFRFYGFLKDYNELSNRHCPHLDVPPSGAVTAILDGQQRLTSLNIGLRGTYANRSPGGWRANPAAYPSRKLYLNVLSEAEENEAGLIYDFRLLTDRQVSEAQDDPAKMWFPVPEVYKAKEHFDMWEAAARHGLANNSDVQRMLSRLWEAVHSRSNIHFYEEEEQDVERVLDIFIRVNSGGTVLSYSDLLLSIATAQWSNRDAREEIHGLVDSLNKTGQGFNFSKDAVLKASLVLAGISDFAFRVKNFNAKNMATLDRDWERISNALTLAADLLSDFGLSEATLPADSVLVPIAYYVQRRGLEQNYRTRVADAADREALRSWTLRSLLMPGVWGSGLDTVLRDLRQAIDSDGASSFPVDEIERRMAVRGKSLVFSDQQIDDLLGLSYGRKRTFALLAILFPHVDTRNVYHVDHVFPRALLSASKLRQIGMSAESIGEYQEKRDLLSNLQLLEGPVNIDKSDTPPLTWARRSFPSEASLHNYSDRNALPWLPDSAEEFERFFTERRVELASRIKATLSVRIGQKS